MGFDLYVVTKEPIKDSSGKLSDQHWGVVTRGFCTLIMNSKYADGHVMTELEKALGLDLSFLLEPEYFNPNGYSEWATESGSEESTTSDSAIDDSTWVEIAPFVQKLMDIQQATTAIPDYESTIEYDRKWWIDYFGAEFRKDVQDLVEFLELAKTQGQQEFSFECSH
jgi:hypothetical protein